MNVIAKINGVNPIRGQHGVVNHQVMNVIRPKDVSAHVNLIWPLYQMI